MNKSKDSVSTNLAYIIGHFIGSLFKAFRLGHRDAN